MAKEGYPESLNCWLENFPKYIQITFGLLMGDLNSPWGNGSILNLIRIGFDTPDSNPVPGEVPPDIKVTYSDTGTDSDWIFKIAMYGWGTFFATTADDNYFIILEKWVEFESTYFDQKQFRHRMIVETGISKEISIPNVEVPIEIIWVPPPEVDDPPPPPVVGDPTIDYGDFHDSWARTLINYYWSLWGITSIISISVNHQSISTNISGFRQLAPTTGCAGGTVEWWTNGNILKVLVWSVTMYCDFTEFGFNPSNCTYDRVISEAYQWTSIYLNGQNILPTLLRRT
jgi:hypothetical protein